MIKYAFIGFALFAVTTAGVCGGSPDEDATPVSDDAFRLSAQAAAEQALITLDDFPAGWQPTVPDPDDEEDDEIPEGLSPECVELFEQFEQMEEAAQGEDADEVASAASNEFNSAYTREGVSTEVEVFRTLERASQGEELFDTAFETCGDELHTAIQDEINNEAEAEGADYRVSDFRMLAFTERDLGDWARDWGFAATYEFEGMQVDATFTLTLIRAGRIGGMFTYYWFDERDEALITSLRSLFAERLTDADRTLPE